ncbi:putative regulator of nonsense transcript [Tritrichomonas foetus]|uniref:Regulator of nonsense transcript n=1 Tax=Tritrichomonas foetus TaxID=1144522 RepID=A0A1J4J1Z4_9EUKA|nr:putative regulator of nonsense transcript [Tritrichomonas foetus]|eukprot:OHS92785.1 putative regulator of nonsense transcript [Tritrichomonas foetus]
MSEPKCEYCGCTNINSLARCTKTGLYFCNGKGTTSASHIVHHLRTMHFDQITLPEQNPFSGVALKCYVCESTNIFELGFLHTKDGSQIFLACRSKCQYDQSLVSHNINNSSFRPLISNGELLPDIVHIPSIEQYTKIPMTRVMAVTQAIKDKLNPPKPEEEGNDDNSGNRRIELPPTKVSYETRDEFVSVLTPFVHAEREETQNLEYSRSFQPITPTWISDNYCTFKAPAPLAKLVSLGSAISFSNPEVNEVGHIVKMTKSMHIDVKFSAPSLFAKQKCSVTVKVVFNSLPFDRQLSALQTFKNDNNCMNKFVANVILGKIEDAARYNPFGKNRVVPIIEPPREHFSPLNASQIRCIKTALAQRFTLIQGPPGTGKTTVIAVLALSLVRAGIKPVLVCCQSNVATDFATRRVSQTGVKVCRVLSSTREQVDNDIDQYTTKKLASEQFGQKFQALLQSANEADRKSITKLEIQVVQSSEVVCTTCTSAGGARLGGGTKFEAVIFDESGQCVDPDLLIPLVRGCQRAILVGDHRQLGPVLISKKSQRARYDLPLMQRLILMGWKPSILKMQYRMHPGLAEFPSKTFYQGFLKDGVTEAKRTWPKSFLTWPNPNIPMFFWNVKSQEEYYENGLSYVNRHELGCIAVLLDSMWKNGINASDIGVITPYAGQQALLIEQLPDMCSIRDEKFFDEIEIASVDAFQGREKNFIILSNVRANDSYDIGFLKDSRRLCVSLTRAKYGLIVIGCADTFSKNKLWCRYIQHCMEKGVFVEGTLNDLQQSEFEPQVSLENDDDEDDDDDQYPMNSAF